MTARDVNVIGVLAVALSLGKAGPATAQSVTTGSPKVEIGGVVSGFPGSRVLGLGLRVTSVNSGRFAVEGEIDWTDALHEQHYVDQITWFFSWQVKHILQSEGASTLFATYGTAGWIERSQSPQSFVQGRFDSNLIPPFLPIVGMGWQRVVGEHVAIRVDGQLLIGPFEGANVIPRAGGGVSIPVGRYRR